MTWRTARRAWQSCASAGRCRSAAAPTPTPAEPASAGGHPARAGASPPPPRLAPGLRCRETGPGTWWARPQRAGVAAARGWRGGARAPSSKGRVGAGTRGEAGAGRMEGVWRVPRDGEGIGFRSCREERLCCWTSE
jgi:hypothetical protein